ncbi:hypothetical protein JYU34_012589 [Plutella xylostella]|uniref:Uncharacterized protein n=1 Tax=Plutella xylostella TaxID=51655 RepID=A0ABQ7QBN7_PLUXY|nr:hypothetical protein JYU34_012589 [Plutella xylostella]
MTHSILCTPGNGPAHAIRDSGGILLSYRRSDSHVHKVLRPTSEVDRPSQNA